VTEFVSVEIEHVGDEPLDTVIVEPGDGRRHPGA
jgi:hypothetical protein